MRMEVLQRLPAWPARMTADVAAYYMGVSKTTFIKRYAAIGVKEGSNLLWAKLQLDGIIAKQFALSHRPGAAGEEIDTWADL